MQPDAASGAITEEMKASRRREYEADEHLLPLEELAKRYNTAIDLADTAHSAGLTSAEAAARLVRFGPNVLTPPKEQSEIIKFLKGAAVGPLPQDRPPFAAPLRR